MKRTDASGKVVRTQQFTELLAGRVDGDTIEFMQFNPREDGTGLRQANFSGKQIPALPPKPDLAKVKFGAPVPLFNGKDLSGWRLVEPSAANGWSIENGTLVNRPDK